MDKKQALKAAEERLKKELTDNQNNQSFFNQYQDSSINSFLKTYVQKKAQLEVYGDFTKFQHQRTLDQFQREGWEALIEIQQKKLFDTECLWRAEEVTNLPEMVTTKDFMLASQSILDYNGIPEISETDIELYQKYLRKPKGFMEYGSYSIYYPSYDDVKSTYQENSETDYEYYDFHNLMTGNHKLLLLPDIRGEKELDYIRCRDNETEEKPKKQEPAKPTTPQKPILSGYDEDDMIAFAKHSNDIKMVNFIKDYKKWVSERPDAIFDWAFEYLCDISPEKVAIKANSDWKEAVYYAAMNHKQNKIAEILPTLYQEYLMKKDAGITISKKSDDTIEVYEMICERWRSFILRGRKIKGEPEDFNF